MEHETMTDDQVWKEVDKAVEELYEQYLSLNELDILSLTRNIPEQTEKERNWNVPTGIEVDDEKSHARLVPTA